MNVLEFMTRFPDEESCKDYYYQKRLKEDSTYKKC